MRYRKAALAVSILFAGVSLVGCSGDSGGAAPADGKIGGTLTGVWDATYKAALDPVVKGFEKKYPDVKVDINYIGGDIDKLISTQLQAGSAPDLLLTYPGGAPGGGASLKVVSMASQNQLMDLSSSAWTSTVPKQWKADVSQEGKTYAYPGAVQGLGALYNKTKMDELGLKPPQTLSDVYAFCDAAKDAGVYAYAQGLGEATAGPQMLSYAQTGTLVYGPDPDFTKKQNEGSATFQDSAWKTQLDIYKKMSAEGCFGEGALGRSRQQGADAVAAGKALGIVDVSAVLAGIKAAAPKNTYDLQAMPATESAADSYMLALPIYTLAVNAKTKNPTTAKAFIEFLAEPENTNLFAEGCKSIPAIPNDSFAPPVELKQFTDLVKDGKFTTIPTWPNAEVQVVLNEAVQSMLLGKDSPEDVLKKMQDAFDQ
ncbi:extracellular solute-binding protein [Streptomyces sp. NPDC052693]|uniref:ABC transporter substrate-binding protein n=1 Tax=Streptomyces sp. NPDC052693 TaxID=3155814 RepID=UPI0034453D37